jgi:nitrogen fixation protein NifU and related proteins
MTVIQMSEQVWLIASSSLVTEWVKGMTLNEASSITNSDISQDLALPPVKIHCSILAEDAIKAAIKDYEMKCSCN